MTMTMKIWLYGYIFWVLGVCVWPAYEYVSHAVAWTLIVVGSVGLAYGRKLIV